MDDQFFLHDTQADLSHYLFNSDDKAHMHSINYYNIVFISHLYYFYDII